MTEAPYRIHKLIQDLYRSKEDRETFKTDPEAIFERFQLTPRERELLRDGSLQSMGALGIHPNLQMKYYEIKFGNFGSVADYFRRTNEKL